MSGGGSCDVPNESHSGLIVKGELKTKYYSSHVNILIDEYPSIRTDSNKKAHDHKQLLEWYDEFKKEECKELRDVLDGFIFTINLDTEPLQLVTKSLEVISMLKELLTDESEDDFFCLIVGVSEEIIDYLEVEDSCINNGLEFVYFNEAGTNEYKDRIGKDRIMEVLETHKWRSVDTSSSEKYTENKMRKVNGSLMESLLGNDNNEDNETDNYENLEEVELTGVLEKLKLAKAEASTMSHEEKELYVQKVIDDLIDYI
ncbi:Increased recombination centers protein 6 [Yamadazyma tenuis]|nr:Increased recombination centers protein 6 [Yamadazyma tenuis]